MLCGWFSGVCPAFTKHDLAKLCPEEYRVKLPESEFALLDSNDLELLKDLDVGKYGLSMTSNFPVCDGFLKRENGRYAAQLLWWVSSCSHCFLECCQSKSSTAARRSFAPVLRASRRTPNRLPDDGWQ
jgi:hypothetical protein